MQYILCVINSSGRISTSRFKLTVSLLPISSHKEVTFCYGSSEKWATLGTGMDAVCFSFDCTFYDDGSSNCTTIYPKYTKTTTYKPTLQPTRPTSANPTTKKTLPTEPITSLKTTEKSTTSKPPPTKPITTLKTTEKSTTAKPPLTKPITTLKTTTKSTTAKPPPTVTSDVIYTTTNISTSSLPMGHKVTPLGRSAGGISIYIPCLVVGCVAVVALLASIVIVRRYKNRRRRLEDRQSSDADTICDLSFENFPFEFSEERRFVQPNTLSPNGDPMFEDISLNDGFDDTEESEVERPDFVGYSSEDSDDLERAAPVRANNIIFDRKTFRTQRERNANKEKVV